MKTKTILLIVLFSIGISTSSYAQNQGPTLTETIDWIRSYVKTNGELMHIKDCNDKGYGYYYIVNFDYETKTLTFTKEGSFNVSINFRNCTSVKKGRLTSTTNNLVKVEFIPDPKSDANCTSNQILFGLNENGDYTKLDKALKHAAELCGAKLMNEDLF